MTEKLKNLLAESRSWLRDPRLWANEHDTRKRSETRQEHADRISMNIEQNCNLADLLDAIDEALDEPPQR